MPAALKTETCTPEVLASLRDDTSQLANMACDLDDLKNRLPHPELRESLHHVVNDMHTAAQYFDKLHGFGLYAAPDGAV